MHRGASGIEFDVRRCGDGSLVVIHDETVDRTTGGRGRVRDLSYAELQQLDAGSGERIPLLTDVLDEFARRCLLNVELKDDGIALDVKKLVLERKLEGQVIVSAFDWDELRPLVPDLPTALLSSHPENLVLAAIKRGAAAIHPRWDITTASLVHATHEAKLRVHVWTVNDPAEISRFREMEVDGVFTDFPDGLKVD